MSRDEWLMTLGHRPLADGRCEHRWRNRTKQSVNCAFLDGFRAALAAPTDSGAESRFVHQGPVEEHEDAHVHRGVVVVTGPVDEVACPLCRPPDMALLDAFAARVPSEPQEP